MNAQSTAAALGRAIADLVRPYAVGDVLEQLVLDCVQEVGAASAAILVREDRDRLVMLSSTSVATSYLEMLQSQELHGPCVDTLATAEPVAVHGADAIAGRWEQVGAAIVREGFEAVEAYPMRWHGDALGGLNVFFRQPPTGSAHRRIAQAFADVATVALVHSDDVSSAVLTRRIRDASHARTQVEQAKGALAHLEGLDIERAHARLHDLADERGTTVSEAARHVLDGLVDRRPGVSGNTTP